MRTRRNTKPNEIRYPIPYNYKPRPIFLDHDPDMPKTWWGWALAFVLAMVFLFAVCMI